MTFEELSQDFRRARLAKKWRPRDIARRTRIQYEYIKLIESGDFSFMPEPIIRGYIKSYARDVGLDQNEMIEKYEQAKTQAQKNYQKEPNSEDKKSIDKKEEKREVEQKIEKPKKSRLPKVTVAPKKEKVEEVKEEKQEKTGEDAKEETGSSAIPPVEPAKETKDKKQSIQEEKKVKASPGPVESGIVQKEEKPKDHKPAIAKPKETAFQEPDTFVQKFRSEIILAGLLLLAIAAVVLLYLKFGTDYFSVEEKPVKKISVFEARGKSLEEKQAKKAVEKQIRKPEKVTLKIVAAEQTWVRMVSDSTDTTEYMFTPGTSRSFEAKTQLELKMGRADGLLIWVNGDSVGKLGSAAEIVGKLVLTPKGIVTKEIRVPKPPRPALRDSTIVLLP